MTIRRLITCSVLLGSVAACSPRASDVSAVRRGDEAFAQGDLEEALAEYRLAIRQGADGPDVVVRVAHTFAVMGRTGDAGAYYLDAVARDSSLADQAITDLMRLARRARDAGESFAMASAVETAQRLAPGMGVGELSLSLARHYYESGEYGRALPFYLKAMGESADSVPEIIFEVGVAHEEVGDCPNALVFFEQFRGQVRPAQRGEVDWYIGTCSFGLARDILDRARSSDSGGAELERALALVTRTLEVGEPRNRQASAWFEKGEILSALGRCREAMDSYSQVRFSDPSSALTDRAQDRFDEIRFGQRRDRSTSGRCR